MSVFEIRPSSLRNGEFAAAWFDDEQCLWDDDRLHKTGSLAGEWIAPRAQLLRPERGVTDVLYNPHGLAVSTRVREELRHFSEIEFLPVAVEGCGTFFLMHVTATVEVSPGFSVRRVTPPSGNVVELFEFPVGYVPSTAFFRVRQPADSAAGRAGYCLRRIYANEEGAGAIGASCGAYLDAPPLLPK